MVFKKVDDVDEDGKPIKRYASGRISTTGLVSPLYGFFEARFETLPVEGMQSAWWLWAENGLWNYENGTPDVGCPGSGSLSGYLSVYVSGYLYEYPPATIR